MRVLKCPLHMADKMTLEKGETDSDGATLRIYEVGYHIIPTVKEEDVEKIVGGIRSIVEKAGGSFIAEAAPALMRLAYGMWAKEGDKRILHDRGYFGWIKFEAEISVAHTLDEALKANQNILRFIVFRTVREDTRAKMKAPQLREVKRTDTIKAAPRHIEKSAAPLSEEQLEKALQDITVD